MLGLTIGLMSLGMVQLSLALLPVRELLTQLQPGSLRREWSFLAALIVTFIVLYMTICWIWLNLQTSISDLVVAVMAFFGGSFVLFVSRLSARTARILGRVAALEREATRDPLTGLFNRRYLDLRIGDEIQRARRFGLPLSAVLIDLDHFKCVNDVFGHAAGDLILRRTGSLLSGALRPTDVIARYGGEELVVIAPQASAAEARALCDRIRELIASERAVLDDGRTVAVTASIGLAYFCGSDTPATLLGRADAALYLAKRLGRDRVCTEADLMPDAA